MQDLQPVLLRGYRDVHAPWPITQPSEPWLPLSGDLSHELIGWVVATMARIDGLEDEDGSGISDPVDALRHLLLSETSFILPGGLMPRDLGTGHRIPPGCCCGLEDWREWSDVLGDHPSRLWLGHDPGPWVEIRPGFARVWSNGEKKRGPSIVDPAEVTYVDLPIGAFPVLMAAAHAELIAFLQLLRQWAVITVPSLAEDLVRVFDRDFDVTRPLGL